MSNENSKQNTKGTNRRVLWISLLGALLLWLSFAPVGIWPLAWLAITPWCWLIEADRLEGRRPYVSIWLAGLVYWMATIYFLPIPHPALWLGWILFSLYLSIFLPLFVGISRTLTQRFSLPSMLVVPMVWTGIEYLRSNYIIAFGTILLGHSQFRFPLMIQTADLFGMYTVSFLMALFAISVTRVWCKRGTLVQTLVPAGIAVTVMAGMCGYGFWRLDNQTQNTDSPVVRAALIQGSIDTEFPATEEEAIAILDRQVEQYRDLTLTARSDFPDLDLIIWPETIFVNSYACPSTEEASMTTEEREWLQEYRDALVYFWEGVTGQQPFEGNAPAELMPPISMLTGVSSFDPITSDRFNSAILIGTNAQVSEVYHKRHRVIMGEYVPLAKLFPILDKMTPIGKGIEQGKEPKVFQVNGLNILPNICFESTVPHLIRSDVNEVAGNGLEPDVLLNLTNDGWFYGTSCLDHHLACNVFRAVEMRKPMLVCANTGFSAVIDSQGRMRQVGRRRDVDILYVNATGEKFQSSLYRDWGDVVPWSFGMICLLGLALGLFRPRKPVSASDDQS